ncbi:MAG: HAD-IA family hydrolase [Bacteroidota bacterium]
MNPLQLIIFDCDGVLVDSEAISNRLVAELLQELSIPMSTEESLRQFAGTSMEYIRNYIHQLTGQPLPENFEAIYRKRSALAFAEELQPIEGVARAIEAIPLPRCVASNGPREKIVTNLKITGLSSFFNDRLFSAYDIQRWKPAPDLYLHAADQMQVATQQCVVVEDSSAGVQAAIAAGMRVLAYGGSGNADRLQAAGATQVFEHMSELPGLVSRL